MFGVRLGYRRWKAWETTQALAGELGTSELHALEIAKNGDGDGFVPEELFGERAQVLGGDLLDALNQFIHREELVEVHFLAREVRHA